MSRIGRSPIAIPSGVEINIAGQEISVKGPKGTLSHVLAGPISIAKEEQTLVVTRPDDGRSARSLHGLSRTLVSNMIEGVTNGYSKTINIVGVGYKVAEKGKDLEFALGYSHAVPFQAPDGITFKSNLQLASRFLVSTSSSLVKLQRRFKSFVRLIHTRARVSTSTAQRFVASKERQVRSNGYRCKSC